MTKEEALKSFEEENKDFEKTFERYGYQMSPEEVSAVKEAIERNKVAISALSGGEYIKKSELLQHVVTEELSDYKECDVIHAEVIDELPTYSFPDSAKNKGDLISRQAVINAIANTCFWLSADNWKELIKCINSIQLVENKCFDGMTNGEVFMSVFPNVVNEEQAKRFFLREWWNAPYQKGETDGK